MKYINILPVEAVQNTKENAPEMAKLLSMNHIPDLDNEFVIIYTYKGSVALDVGDYAIRHESGVIYPCKKEKFEKTYVEFKAD